MVLFGARKRKDEMRMKRESMRNGKRMRFVHMYLTSVGQSNGSTFFHDTNINQALLDDDIAADQVLVFVNALCQIGDGHLCTAFGRGCASMCACEFEL